MQKLTRADLYSLEDYAERRAEFRRLVMAHKKLRQLQIGPNALLQFEDRLTMHYQVQEMLRIERIFQRAGIEEELAAYNPLIPDGTNWKATLMVEFEDPEVRRRRLAELIGVEDRTWVSVDGGARVWAIADEDLPRETEDKTSSVHFMRFELAPEQIAAVKRGAPIAAGIDHEQYRDEVNPVSERLRAALADDLI